jgi:chitinase
MGEHRSASKHGHKPRIITYHQTIYHNDAFVSLLPLLTESTGVTHVIVAAIHLNSPTHITLNDDPWDAPKHVPLWDETRILQAHDIKVLGMLGGAARGSYLRLDGDSGSFEIWYRGLRELLVTTGLDGIDLDIEEAMSLGGVIRLVDRLRHDFGPDFLITMAPVAPGLRGQSNLHGFDLEVVEKAMGRHIAWYNAQFYCGWGDMSNIGGYEMILARGCWPVEKVVIGLVTNPGNGSGWVRDDAIKASLKALAKKYPNFGGVMGWEYFNSMTEKGGEGKPWTWAKFMKDIFHEAEEERNKESSSS